MKKLLSVVAVLALVVLAGMKAAEEPKKPAAPGNIAHMVYFQLKDNSPEAKQKLVEACKKYLDKHEGTVYFSVGVRGEDFNREVNDREWDVALHLVFKNKAAHDKYQE